MRTHSLRRTRDGKNTFRRPRQHNVSVYIHTSIYPELRNVGEIIGDCACSLGAIECVRKLRCLCVHSCIERDDACATVYDDHMFAHESNRRDATDDDNDDDARDTRTFRTHAQVLRLTVAAARAP